MEYNLNTTKNINSKNKLEDDEEFFQPEKKIEHNFVRSNTVFSKE
jgi:hypothetical protein